MFLFDVGLRRPLAHKLCRAERCPVRIGEHPEFCVACSRATSQAPCSSHLPPVVPSMLASPAPVSSSVPSGSGRLLSLTMARSAAPTRARPSFLAPRTAALDHGLSLNHKMCKPSSWLCQRDLAAGHPPGRTDRRDRCFKLFGVAFCPDECCQAAIPAKRQVHSLVVHSAQIGVSALILILTLFSLGWCQLSYHARMTPPTNLLPGATHPRNAPVQCLSSLLHTLTEKARPPALISEAKGTLGIRDLVISHLTPRPPVLPLHWRSSPLRCRRSVEHALLSH